MSETGKQSIPVSLLKLVEATAIEDSCQHCLHIDVTFVIHRNNPVKLVLSVEGLLRPQLVIRVFFVIRLG
jgi:hypothetical protein